MRDDREKTPTALVEAHEAGFDYDGGAGIDFESYDAFLSPAETADWLRAWTGNADLDGAEFRFFGQDGTGGSAAFWLVRAGEPVDRQPVVFLGSEGETAVVARDLGAYLWLLAGGFGPLEASMYPRHEHRPRPDVRLIQLAERHAPTARRSPERVIAEARAEFPHFDAVIESWCR